jgi:hypothetical protein
MIAQSKRMIADICPDIEEHAAAIHALQEIPDAAGLIAAKHVDVPLDPVGQVKAHPLSIGCCIDFHAGAELRPRHIPRQMSPFLHICKKPRCAQDFVSHRNAMCRRVLLQHPSPAQARLILETIGEWKNLNSARQIFQAAVSGIAATARESPTSTVPAGKVSSVTGEIARCEAFGEKKIIDAAMVSAMHLHLWPAASKPIAHSLLQSY